MTELPIEQLLLEVVRVVEKLKIPYAIMGGFAVRAWGIPRPTYDADIAISVNESELQKLFDALERSGFDVPPEHKTGFVDVIARFQKAKVTRFAARSVWDIDLFLAHDRFLQLALSRARACDIGGQTVQVMVPEDVILLKLTAFRLKDQLDIEEILKVHTKPDIEHLDKWAAYLGVTKRLRRFIP